MSAANLIQTTGDPSDAARAASNVAGGEEPRAAPREAVREPSMEDILASIRRIIAQDQSLFAIEAATGAHEAGEAGDSPRYGRQDVETEALANRREEDDPDEGDGEPLVSPATDVSVATAFRTLVASHFARDPEAIAALTREALRPVLASWLDANLPALVERLIRDEIDRIAKGA